MRIVHPSLEGVILKPGKPFPGVHFQKSALQGHPHYRKVLVSMRRAEKFPPYSTVSGARSSSVCSLSLGIRAAQSHSNSALSRLGCVRMAHADSSAAHMGVCLQRAQRAVKKADEGLCQGEMGTRERPGLGPACCPGNQQAEDSALFHPPLPVLPRGRQNNKDKPSPGCTLRSFQSHKGK